VAGMLAAQENGGTTQGGVHTVEELNILKSALDVALKDTKYPTQEVLAWRTVIGSLIAAAMRREFDAVFGWSARPAQTIFVKDIVPAFGDLAGKLPPTDKNAAKKLLVSRARLGDSLDANSATVQHIKALDDAYGNALEEVFELVGDRKAEKLDDVKSEQSVGFAIDMGVEVGTKVLDHFADDKSLGEIAENCGKASNALELVSAAYSALKGIADAVVASNKADVVAFTTMRDVALLRERVEVDKRLGLLNLCDMMGALEAVLRNFLAQTNVKAAAPPSDEIIKIILGTDSKMKFSKAFEARISRSFFARLCSLLAPVHNRIAALFRGAGKCQSDAIAPLLTPATDAARYKDALKRPTRGLLTSGNDDIYDVQLVSGSDADLTAWAGYGYEQLQDGGSPVELNADLCDTERGLKILNSCKPNTAAKPENSRRILILRRSATIGKSKTGEKTCTGGSRSRCEHSPNPPFCRR